MFKRAGMLAPDGRCKTLDSAADGYVRGEACVSAMLELVAQDGMSSSAVAYILGSAVNQDGRSSSLTAPNGPAQQGVIRQALQGGALQPCDVGVLQMHGTGAHEPPAFVASCWIFHWLWIITKESVSVSWQCQPQSNLT